MNFRAFAERVGAPAVVFLRFGLAPSEEVAVFLRAVGSDVAGSPQSAAGQSEVNPFHRLGLLEGDFRHFIHIILDDLAVRRLNDHLLRKGSLHPRQQKQGSNQEVNTLFHSYKFMFKL